MNYNFKSWTGQFIQWRNRKISFSVKSESFVRRKLPFHVWPMYDGILPSLEGIFLYFSSISRMFLIYFRFSYEKIQNETREKLVQDWNHVGWIMKYQMHERWARENIFKYFPMTIVEWMARRTWRIWKSNFSAGKIVELVFEAFFRNFWIFMKIDRCLTFFYLLSFMIKFYCVKDNQMNFLQDWKFFTTNSSPIETSKKISWKKKDCII